MVRNLSPKETSITSISPTRRRKGFPKKFAIVLALLGDSTITKTGFISSLTFSGTSPFRNLSTFWRSFSISSKSVFKSTSLRGINSISSLNHLTFFWRLLKAFTSSTKTREKPLVSPPA